MSLKVPVCVCVVVGVFPVSETLLTHTKDVSEISGPLALQHFGIPARHSSNEDSHL